MKHSSSPLPKPRWQGVTTFTLMSCSSLSMLMAEPTHPQWWSDGDPPVIDPSAEVSNFSPVNIGQAKWVVSEALRTLDNVAPGIAFEIQSDLAGTPPDYLDQIVDVSIPNTKDTAWIETQQAMLSLGQLKAIALPFYNYLNQADPDWVASQIVLNHGGSAELSQHYWLVSGNTRYTDGGYYPWNPATPVADNKVAANIGQLKAIFALRFSDLPASVLDFDNDGLLDSWEQLVVDFDLTDDITQVSDVLASDDFDGDGVSNEDEFAAGTDPTDPDSYPQLSSFDIDQDGWLDEDDVNTEVLNNPNVGLSVTIF